MQVHKFYLNGLYIVLDINSGAVHIVDNLVYDIMDVFNGANAAEVVSALKDKYDQAAVMEAMSELTELSKDGQLFSPELTVPLTLSQQPLVKSLCLHVAHDCNLRCGYCFAGAGDFGHTRGLMSREIGEKAVDFIIANSGQRRNCELDFFGGEPLLNMDTVRHVVSYVRQRETETGKVFKLTLTTNAVLLNDDIIGYLNDNNISLVLSLDGRPETHDRMRPCVDGSGSYHEAVTLCQQVAQSRGESNYYLRGTFTAHNLDFAADVLAMADMGFTQLSVEPVVATEGDYALTAAHLPELYRQYELLAEAYLEHKLAGTGFDFFHFNLDLSNGPCVAKRLSGCGAGHEYFAVTPEGDLYPCHQFVGRDEYKLGNVHEGVQNTELPARFRQAHVLNKPTCRQCWARFYCSGGCHANADLFHHDLYQPYELGCDLQKKRLECAIMIQAKLAIARNGEKDL